MTKNMQESALPHIPTSRMRFGIISASRLYATFTHRLAPGAKWGHASAHPKMQPLDTGFCKSSFWPSYPRTGRPRAELAIPPSWEFKDITSMHTSPSARASGR